MHAQAILTKFQLNLPSLLENLLSRRPAAKRDIIDSFGDKVTEVAGGIGTVLPADATSGVQGVASTATSNIGTLFPDIASQIGGIDKTAFTAITSAIEEILPRNCSIGTTGVCIGLGKSLSCHNVPIQALWIVGLVLKLLIVVASFLSLVGYLKFSLVRGFVLVIIGVFCLLAFVIPVAMLGLLKAAVGGLPQWIEVSEGKILWFLAGGLGCAAVVVSLGGIVEGFLLN